MNEGNGTTVAINVGLPTITVIEPITDPSLLRSIKALQVISAITGILLLIIHVSFIIYILEQTRYTTYYFIYILLWPICLIVCVAKSIVGIFTRILQFIWVGFALSTVGSFLYLFLLLFWLWLEYLNTYAWLAFIGGVVHGSIALTLAIKLQQLTPIEYEQSQNCLCKCNAQSYLRMRAIEYPLSYVEQSRKVNMFAIILLLVVCVVLFVFAYAIYPIFGYYVGIVVCLPVTIFLIISLVGVITRSASAVTVGFVLCTASWVCMFTIVCDLLSRESYWWADENWAIVIFSLVFSILGMIQCLIMLDYAMVLLDVAKVQVSQPIAT